MMRKGSERGQSIVLLSLAILGLLGFMALAVDGGTVFVERRRSQAAADAAAFAAALSGANGEDWSAAGQAQANLNGFDNTASNIIVDVNNPPVSGVYSGDNEYYQVIITSTSMPIFSQVFFSEGLTNTAEAVTRVIPGSESSTGNALFSTNETACNALTITGKSETLITGGDIYSNSNAQGKKCTSIGVAKLPLTVSDGGIFAVGDISINKKAIVTADEIKAGVAPKSVPKPPDPDCSGLPTGQTCKNCSGTLNPGIYPKGISNNNRKQTWKPGLYCLQGDLKLTGGTSVGNGVMIYMQSGKVDIHSKAEFDLRAELSENVVMDASKNDWKGMLIYMDPVNIQDIKIAINSDSYLLGAIHAIGPSKKEKCTFSGSKNTFLIDSQIICDTIKVVSNSGISITYDGTYGGDTTTILELVQ
jgi:hypothetical protein